MPQHITRYTITLWDNYVPDMNFFTYFCMQKEKCPQTGTEHFQSYGETLGRKFKTVSSYFFKQKIRCNIISASGTASENRDYCSKRKSKIGDFFEYGAISPDTEQGKRTDLDTFAKRILAGDDDERLSQAHPGMMLKYYNHVKNLRGIKDQKFKRALRTIKAVWLVGPPGTGKSFSAFTWAMERGDFDQPLISNSSVWFESYQGSDVLILDELRTGDLTSSLLNRFLDGYPLPINVKGSSSFACWSKVIITSNYFPQNFNSTGLLRRVNVIEVEGRRQDIHQQISSVFQDQF